MPTRVSGASGARGAGDRAAGDGGAPASVAGVHVGARLRAARLAARKSMAEVAEDSGLTKGFVSKLERDLANVSVASLIRLCEALGISVGSLFQSSRGEVIRSGAYPPINFGGTGVREYLLTPSGEKRMQAILSDIEPGGGSGTELYTLPADVEFVFMLAGAGDHRRGHGAYPGRGGCVHLRAQHRARVPGAARSGAGPGAVGVLACPAGQPAGTFLSARRMAVYLAGTVDVVPGIVR